MENNNNKLEGKDYALAGLGAFIAHKSKDAALGVTSLYHGTTKEGYKGIKREGLLTSKANSNNGATKWLADFMKERTLLNANLKNGMYSTKPANYYSVNTDAASSLISRNEVESAIRRGHVTPEVGQKFIETWDSGKMSGTHKGFKSGHTFVSVPKAYNADLNDSHLKLHLVDDAYIKEYGDASVNEVLKNTNKNVFVTKHRPHANLYSYMSQPGRFSNLMTDIATIAADSAKDGIEASSLKKGAKRVLNRLGVEWLKAQNPIAERGKVVKMKVPTTHFDKHFTMDAIVDNPEVNEMVEKLKTGTNSERISYKILKNFQAKSSNDISTKYINLKERPKVFADAIKAMPEYIKAHPGKFAAGVGGTALGAYLLKEPIRKAYENIF